MPPLPSTSSHPDWDGSWKTGLSIEGFIVESWSQGFLVGALFIMAATTVANMRTDSLLHKLILVELVLAMFHGTFCFMTFAGYDWYLSSTAVLLYTSLCLHNLIAWMKTKPCLKKWQSRFYLCSFLLTLPYWILEAYLNFAYFNNINRLFKRTRPFEALCRDIWWIFTALNLVYNVKNRYNFDVLGLIKVSPRFGVMLISMFLSIIFLVTDVVFAAGNFGGLSGINPYWKFSLVLKCLCDTIILDDFQSALERVRARYFNHINKHSPHSQHYNFSQNDNAELTLTSSRKKSIQKRLVPIYVSKSGDEFVVVPQKSGDTVVVPHSRQDSSASSIMQKTADSSIPWQKGDSSGKSHHFGPVIVEPAPAHPHTQGKSNPSQIVMKTDIFVDRSARRKSDTYGSSTTASND